MLDGELLYLNCSVLHGLPSGASLFLLIVGPTILLLVGLMDGGC
jgi:hypothetical protein